MIVHIKVPQAVDNRINPELPTTSGGTMRRLASLVLMFAVAGCGSDVVDALTGTTSPLSLSFSGTTTVTGQRTTVNAVSVYACTFSFVVTARSGTSGEVAIWSDGDVNFRLTSNGQTSQLSLSSTDLLNWFGVDRVAPGGKVTADRSLNWSGPFTGSVVFRYTLVTRTSPLGEAHSDAVPFTCQ